MHAGSDTCLFLVSVAASALGGTLGMASGVFIVPFLTLGAGIGIHAAVATSIVSVIACSCASAGPFLRNGLTNIRVAIVLETATTLGALSGVLLAGVLPVPILFLLFAAILLVSAWQMLQRRRAPAAAAPGPRRGDWASVLRLHATYPDRALGQDVAYRVQRVPLGLVLMYGAGLISALLGIGSGVLKIPALDTALRLPLKVSSATSELHDRRDRGRQRTGLSRARRHRSGHRRPGRPGIDRRFGAGRAPPDDRLRRLVAAAVRRRPGHPGSADAAGRRPGLSGAASRMNDNARDRSLRQHLATMLQLGTWAGTCLIATGWGMSAIHMTLPRHAGAEPIVQAGITLLILLPGLRVLLMAAVFIRQRDYRFGAIAVLVLAIILAGAISGIHAGP